MAEGLSISIVPLFIVFVVKIILHFLLSSSSRSNIFYLCTTSNKYGSKNNNI